MEKKPQPRYLIGRDGWPTDPEFNARVEVQGEMAFRIGMQQMEARWLEGDYTAIRDAVRACRAHNKEPPGWIVEATDKLVELAMGQDERNQRRLWENHLARWEALTELRDRRHELHKLGDDRGMSWERARAAVSEALQGTPAAGNEDTVKASYEIVQAAGGAEATFERYLTVRAERAKRRR
jgi:hypothetical protein